MLAFFSIQLTRALTPPSALSEALLFFHPVTLSSASEPPLLLCGGRMLTSPEAAACLRIAPRALPLVRAALVLGRDEVRDIKSPPLLAGAGDDFDMPPLEALPFPATSIFRSPSRSVLAAARRRVAAGPRGAVRGALLPTAMATVCCALLCCLIRAIVCVSALVFVWVLKECGLRECECMRKE